MKSISARTFFHDFIDCSVLSFIITKHSNFFILVFPKKKIIFYYWVIHIKEVGLYVVST